MSKVTSKLQVTIPKAIADKYRIRPGDEVRWEVREPGPMMVPEAATRPRLTPEERVALFREEMERIDKIHAGRTFPKTDGRGWTRDDLYEDDEGHCRGMPR